MLSGAGAAGLSGAQRQQPAELGPAHPHRAEGAAVQVVVVAKTTEPAPTLPGTIYTVAKEVEQLGVRALACRVDMRRVDQVERCVADTLATFGRIDILINNASALWWQVSRGGTRG